MTMTLGQVRDTLDEWGCSSLGQVQISTQLLRKMRDAIDAHLAGTGDLEVIACSCCERTDTLQTQCVNCGEIQTIGTVLPIDIAAVREVIAELRSPATVFLGEPANEVSKGWADKLESAIKGASHG